MFNFPCRGGDRKERDGRGAATEPGGDGEDEEKLGAAAQGARGRVPGTVYTACLGLRGSTEWYAHRFKGSRSFMF